MRVLITGANGQLGFELQRTAPAGVSVIAAGRTELELGSDDLAEQAVSMQPDLIINAAAYTAVDKAESEPELAHAINARGAAGLAAAAARLGVPMLHVSTDFVFDGSTSSAYLPDAPTAPIGVYGASKLAGEQAVLGTAGIDACIVRTAWVYSSHGGNFVKTMLRLMAEKESLGVVADQIGTPTWAHGLASVLWALAALPERAQRLHWTDLGVASWFDFAVAIQEEALARGLLSRAIPIRPIATTDYPTPARRPAFSVLDKSATLALTADRVEALHWRVALRAMLDELTT